MHQNISKPLCLEALPILDETKAIIVYRAEKLGNDQAGVRFLFFLLAGCYIPVLLLWSEIIPFAYRFHALSAVIAGYFVFFLNRGYCCQELGYTTDNLWNSIRWNLVFCVFGASCLYLTYEYGFLRPRSEAYLSYSYVAYLFFLAPAQELLFRGILFAEIRRSRISDPRLILMISSLSFCFLHLIYNHPPLLVISFVSGLIWGILFIKWPNIWGVSISHSILGAFAMFLGVI